MAITDKLTAVADAIRSKTGKAESMTIDQMPLEIAGIAAGGGTDGLRTYTFTINEDVSVAANTTKIIAVIEENTDIVPGTCAGFVIFEVNGSTTGNPNFLFTPDILSGFGTHYTATKSILSIHKGTYSGNKQLVQLAIVDGDLVFGTYSSGTAVTIPAGTYTAYIVTRIS